LSAFLFNLQVWWSPCPSRECPEEPELDLAVYQCVDYCLMQEQTNPQLYTDLPMHDKYPTATTRRPTTSTTAMGAVLSPGMDASESNVPTTTLLLLLLWWQRKLPFYYYRRCCWTSLHSSSLAS